VRRVGSMTTKVSRPAWIAGAAGVLIGGVAAALVRAGNPGNMGVCVACFVRDIAGTAGGAGLNMGGVAYLRPEIPALVLGALLAALAGREFRARGGSAFLARFVIGFAFMCAALVFLGCTVRAWLRVGGGDLGAAVGVVGLVAGVGAGAMFLRSGFNLGRARSLPAPAGWIGPAIALALLALAAAAAWGAAPSFLTVTPAGAPTPAGKRAPLVVSAIAGILLGAVAQRTRFCTTGGIRDAILVRRYGRLLGVAGLVGGAVAVNLALGQFRLGLAGQPVAHTDLAGNFAAMAVAGLAAVLMGGCPLRQVVMAGEGDLDALGALLGMAAAALFMHGYGIASSPKGLAPAAWPALAAAAVVLAGIGLARRERASVPQAATEPQP
jgi:YedE family putative selenium metabolism protein